MTSAGSICARQRGVRWAGRATAILFAVSFHPAIGAPVCCLEVGPRGPSCETKPAEHCETGAALAVPETICCGLPLLARDCTGNACVAGKGACAEGAYACAGGRLVCLPTDRQACGGKPPPCPEACDGLDNDCDGFVDEGFGQVSCGGPGECRNTVPVCLDGQLQTCEPNPPREEVCDCLDNDCDGLVDEGLDCPPCPH